MIRHNEKIMANYAEIKKLDEESLQKLTEGEGPADECLCPLLSPPIEKKNFARSVKRALSAFGKSRKPNRVSNMMENIKESGDHSLNEIVNALAMLSKLAYCWIL